MIQVKYFKCGYQDVEVSHNYDVNIFLELISETSTEITITNIVTSSGSFITMVQYKLNP